MFSIGDTKEKWIKIKDDRKSIARDQFKELAVKGEVKKVQLSFKLLKYKIKKSEIAFF